MKIQSITISTAELIALIESNLIKNHLFDVHDISVKIHGELILRINVNDKYVETFSAHRYYEE